MEPEGMYRPGPDRALRPIETPRAAPPEEPPPSRRPWGTLLAIGAWAVPLLLFAYVTTASLGAGRPSFSLRSRSRPAPVEVTTTTTAPPTTVHVTSTSVAPPSERA